MTFATDLLRKHGQQVPVQLEPVEQPKQRPSQIVKYAKRSRKNARAGKSNMRGMHYASTPCIYRYEYGWRVYIPHSETGTKMLVGVYKEWPRARIGFKLFMHWLARGFAFDEIPRLISPQFRRHGIVYHEAMV